MDKDLFESRKTRTHRTWNWFSKNRGKPENTKRKTPRSNGETRKHTFDLLNFSTVGKNVLLRTIIVLSVMPH